MQLLQKHVAQKSRLLLQQPQATLNNHILQDRSSRNFDDALLRSNNHDSTLSTTPRSQPLRKSVSQEIFAARSIQDLDTGALSHAWWRPLDPAPFDVIQ